MVLEVYEDAPVGAVHGHHSWHTGTQDMHDPWHGHGSTAQNRGAGCKLKGCQYSKEAGKEHIHRPSSPCSIGQAQSSASEEPVQSSPVTMQLPCDAAYACCADLGWLPCLLTPMQKLAVARWSAFSRSPQVYFGLYNVYLTTLQNA